MSAPVGVVRLVRSLAAILLVVSLAANGQDVKSWGNLNSIAAGQALEVHKVAGGSVRGNYAAHSEQSIELTVNQQLVSIARAQVSEVQRSQNAKGYVDWLSGRSWRGSCGRCRNWLPL